QFDASPDVAGNRVFAFDHDQGADSILGQVGEGSDQNIDGIGAQRPHAFRCPAPYGDALENLSELFLKNDDDNDQEDRKEALKQPGSQLQIEIARDDINRGEYENTPDDKRGASLFEPRSGRVEQHRYHENIGDIGDSDIEKR